VEGAGNDRGHRAPDGGRHLRPGERGGEPVHARGDVEAGGGGAGRPLPRRLDHLADGGDPGDGLLAEGKGVGDRTHELAGHENGAAAHAGDDPGRLEGLALEAGEDHALLRPHGVVEHAEDPDAELLHARSLEDGPARPLHPRADLVEGEELGGEDGGGDERGGEGQRGEGDGKPERHLRSMLGSTSGSVNAAP
jgi:hypothetical protein